MEAAIGTNPEGKISSGVADRLFAKQAPVVYLGEGYTLLFAFAPEEMNQEISEIPQVFASGPASMRRPMLRCCRSGGSPPMILPALRNLNAGTSSELGYTVDLKRT